VSAPDPNPVTRGATHPSWRGRLHAAAVAALAAVGLIVAVVAADTSVLLHRSPTVEVDAPGSDDGTAYLLLASDSRARLTGSDARRYKDAAQAEGERADLVMVLRSPAAGDPQLLSIPRDLFVGATGTSPHRLGMALERGPQAMVDSLCDDLGIGVDHVAVLDFSGLVDLVDAAGGVTVRTDGPTFDRRAGLQLRRGGEHRLDGHAALAWVRSRDAGVLVDGKWRRPSDFDPTRTTHAADVLGQTTRSLRNPARLQAAAWAVGPQTRRDDDLGLRGLAQLALDLRYAVASGRVHTVPVRLTRTAVPVAFPTTTTRAVLEPFRTSTCDGHL